MKKTLCIAALLLSQLAFAEVAVIVHPSNNNALDEATVAKIFLGREKSFADGKSVVPVSLSETAAASTAFNDTVLKKSSSQLKAYWSKLVFTGKGTPPKEITSDEEMIKLVATNPSLIGYVDASKVDASVKVALKF
ncbi:MAG TPA: phosphate ABC transporter substrate-binding protein [Rheinheimera sp.]|uniref:phosphate ABC transporter substrate-binding protein n=1 Tax=Rheinheimera sp. TaxID=1869214 RepID=UPI000EC42333|nr:phosphate ABC transporter substrate-binding protein [Rheinheimera sp.]HCU67137.1 phosphate ABC transporter substrate-binding protein [Rheinheimera sp.]